MKRFLKKVHYYCYLGSVAFFFFLLYPPLYYFSRKPHRFPVLNRFRQLLGFLSSAAVGIFYSSSFEEPIDWTKKYIVCANHSSMLDITGVTLLLRSNFAFMGKEELLNNPVTRLFFETIDIPLNRESKFSSFRAFKRADEYLRRGMTVVIYPEGRIPDEYPPKLSSFKHGPFRLAIEHQIPIIPISITDAWKKMWDDGSAYGSRPGICHLYVHAPVDTRGLSVADAESLSNKIHHLIQEGLTQNEA